MTSSAQIDEGVEIKASDGTVYHDDILFGADDKYSVICQNLYEQLEKKGIQPESDKEKLPFTNACQ
ncbi:hypothetical protein BGX27_009489, partial [Mortierella sp. AM989]